MRPGTAAKPVHTCRDRPLSWAGSWSPRPRSPRPRRAVRAAAPARGPPAPRLQPLLVLAPARADAVQPDRRGAVGALPQPGPGAPGPASTGPQLLDDTDVHGRVRGPPRASSTRTWTNGADHWFAPQARRASSTGPIAYFCAEYGLHESLGHLLRWPRRARRRPHEGRVRHGAAVHRRRPDLSPRLLPPDDRRRRPPGARLPGLRPVTAAAPARRWTPTASRSRSPCELPERDLAVAVWLAQVGRVPLLLLDTDIPDNDDGGPADHAHPVRPRPRDAAPPGAGPGRRRRPRAARAGHRAGGLAPQRGPLRVPARRAGARAASPAATRSTRPGSASGATACSRSTRRSRPATSASTPTSCAESPARSSTATAARTGGVPIDRSSSSAVGVDGDPEPVRHDGLLAAPHPTARTRSASSTRETANATWHGASPRADPGHHQRRPPADAGSGSRCASPRAAASAPISTTRRGAPRGRFWERLDQIPDERAVGGAPAPEAGAGDLRARRLRSQFARHGEAPARSRSSRGARSGRPDDRLRAPVRDLQARRAAVHRRGAAGAPAVERGAPGPDRLRRQGAPRRPARPARDPGHLRAQPLAAARAAACSSSRTTTSGSRATSSQGVDVWLNNPRRPLEASGTSGMKAAMNGVVNCSRARRLVGRGLERRQRLGDRRPRDRTPTRARRTGPTRRTCTGSSSTRSCPATTSATRTACRRRWLAADAALDGERRSGSSRRPGCSRSTSSGCTCRPQRRRGRPSRDRRCRRDRADVLTREPAPEVAAWPARISLALVIHNHQPVGNFGWVFEEVFDQAYEPMIDALERHPTSGSGSTTRGPLLEWLAAERPSSLDSAARARRARAGGDPGWRPVRADPRVAAGARPARPADAHGGDVEAIFRRRAARRVARRARLGAGRCPSPSPRRGYGYTILDDNHLRGAAIPEEDLWGTYTTDDQGQPADDLRHGEGAALPDPVRDRWRRSSSYLREHATEDGGRVGMMGDDGEKFGALAGHLRALLGQRRAGSSGSSRRSRRTPTGSRRSRRRQWLDRERADRAGSTCPTASYVEMTEWALPPEETLVLRATAPRRRGAEHRPEARWLRGGFWRNFQVELPRDQRPPQADAARRRRRSRRCPGARAGRGASTTSTAASPTTATGTACSAASTSSTCAWRRSST